MYISSDSGDIINGSTTQRGTYILTTKQLLSAGFQSYGELGFGSTNQQQAYFSRVAVSEDISNFNNMVSHENYAFLVAEKPGVKLLSGGEIAGITIGAIAGAAALGAGIFFLTKYICSKRGTGYKARVEGNLEHSKLVNEEQW